MSSPATNCISRLEIGFRFGNEHVSESNDNRPIRYFSVGTRVLIVAFLLHVASMFMPAMRGYGGDMLGWECAWICLYFSSDILIEVAVRNPGPVSDLGWIVFVAGAQVNLFVLASLLLVWSKRWSLRWMLLGFLSLAALLALMIPGLDLDFMSETDSRTFSTLVADLCSRYSDCRVGYFFWTGSLCVASVGAWLRLKSNSEQSLEQNQSASSE